MPIQAVTATDQYVEESNVELNMMHFTPSASPADGIHYVCRLGVDTVACFGVSEVHFCVDGVWFTSDFPGSNQVIPVGEGPTGSVTNYLFGNDPSKWMAGLVDCSVLKYRQIYPGIDLAYRVRDGYIKYEFIVEPNADTSVIAVRYPDADALVVCDDRVTVSEDGCEMEDAGLRAFQRGTGLDAVPCAFRALDRRTVGFSVGSYDTSRELVIDPAIYMAYSTFLGGASDDSAYGMTVDSGCIYVTGPTQSSEFPTVNANDSTHNGGRDCFVTKLAADGQSLVFSTFLGGASNDYGAGIVVENGYVYVGGYTTSSGFPTVNANDSTYNGGVDCFISKLAIDGQSIVFSTFLGGASDDIIRNIAVESGCAYVTGHTGSTDFPTVNAYDSTYNGGTYDCFVTKLAADGQSLVYSTFLGAAFADAGYGIAVESGCAYVAGYTSSSGFPTANAYDSTHNGGSDCFTAVLCPDSDMDGLLDWYEARYGTDPFCIDSDNDNFLDGYEVAYGSNATDPMSYPAMPQAWYESIYEGLEGNSTLIQNLISWSNGNTTLLQTVMQQLDSDSALLQQVIAWLDGNHTAIETLFTYLEGNATLLMQTVDAVDASSDQLTLLAALVTQNTEVLTTLNATHIGDMAQIRTILDMLGVTVGDTDCDGLDDLDEIAIGTDIQCIDTDCDNLNDAYEVKIGTDPTDDDSDNDTFYDGAEVLAGTDPLDPLDYPGSTGTTTGPLLSIELIVIVGAVGCVGLVALLVIGRRRTGAKSSS